MSIPAVVVALGVATGVFLIVSPLLWPRSQNSPADSIERIPRPGRIRALLDDAGLAHVSTGAFVSLSAVLCVSVTALVFLLSPVWVLAVCAGLMAACVPAVMLVNRRARRAAERAGVWPDIADTLVSNVRAGRSIVEAVSALGDTAPGSIGAAAITFAERTRVSGNVDACLRALKTEWADPAGDRIVEALCVTRDVGGTRLTSVLRDVSRTLRLDLAVRREVAARQSWIRVAAGIGAAAPWVVVALLSMRAEAVTAYQSSAGATLIFGGLALSVVAYQIMIRIGRLRPEKRWFR